MHAVPIGVFDADYEELATKQSPLFSILVAINRKNITLLLLQEFLQTYRLLQKYYIGDMAQHGLYQAPSNQRLPPDLSMYQIISYRF